MRLTGKVRDVHGEKYTLKVEADESIDVLFDPDGVNAPLNSNNEKRALSIRGMTLPGGDLALAISLNDDLLYKDIPLDAYPACFIVCHNFGVSRAEFVMNKECPRVELVLEKISSQELLKEHGQDNEDQT